MTAFRLWTLTCDGCGEIHDSGRGFTLTDEKRHARAEGWQTGNTARDEDRCPKCRSDR